jgi:hypothetical protein
MPRTLAESPDGMVTSDPPVALPPRRLRWLPFGDPSRGRRLVKVLAWLAATAAVIAVLGLFGVDVVGWFERLWDALTGIGLGTSQPAGRCRRCKPC